MASKSAVLKLLEEKYSVKKGELEKSRLAQTRDLYKERELRRNEILDYIKSQVIPLVVPCASSGKKKHAATFQVELKIDRLTWQYTNVVDDVYMKDPTYSHLSNLIKYIEKATGESLSQLAKEYKAIREAVILTGVPENIKELLSKFEGV